MALVAPARLAAAGPDGPDTLVSKPYLIRAAPSFPGGLFHWVDALADTSAGKTNAAHREQFLDTFGRPTPADRDKISEFVNARSEFLKRQQAEAARDGSQVRVSALLGIFCAAGSVEEAMATIRPRMPETAWAQLADALAWFRPKYEIIWNGGAVPSAFLSRARTDPHCGRLEDVLASMVRFYGVDAAEAKPPFVALVPVPPGHGTHAEAIGDVLLLEIRPNDGLADEASVIAHESAHWLWGLLQDERRKGLETFAARLDERGRETYALFHEAIPTALGQGVTDRVFRPGSWSLDDPWYHTFDVDVCAKSIYPVVRYTLESGGALDEAFLRRAIDAAERGPAAPRGLNPRSP